MKKTIKYCSQSTTQSLDSSQLAVVSGGGGDGADVLIGQRGDDSVETMTKYSNITLKRG